MEKHIHLCVSLDHNQDRPPLYLLCYHNSNSKCETIVEISAWICTERLFAGIWAYFPYVKGYYIFVQRQHGWTFLLKYCLRAEQAQRIIICTETIISMVRQVAQVNLSFFLNVLASLLECFFSPVTMLNELSYRAWRCSHRMYRCLDNHMPMGSFRALAKENVACRTLLKNSSFSRQFAKAQRTPLFFTLRLRRRPKRTPRNDSWGIYVSHEWFP